MIIIPNVVKKTLSVTNPFAITNANDAYMNVKNKHTHMDRLNGNNGIAQLANNLKYA